MAEAEAQAQTGTEFAAQTQPAPEPDSSAPVADSTEIDIRSADELYAMYMPFVSGGGLFLSGRRLGERNPELGSELNLALRLSADDEQFQVLGRVVWLTPSSRKQGVAAGAGVQLLDNGEAQARIERLLTGMLSSERPTLTL